jgi:hypothetical protein
MGAGVTAQFHAMSFPGQADCLSCHAPLSEQLRQLQDSQGRWSVNRSFDSGLALQGVVCAACHLRYHVRHGPPIVAGKVSVSQLVHGEPVRTPHFEASEFCKTCHQHGPGFQTPGGKPVENTYAEWLSSPFPKRGMTCQSCHMPERRHLWKGIHDPETTRSAVAIQTTVDPAKPLAGQSVEATLALINSGAGHAFPTYTTPAVHLRAAFLDERNRPLPGEPVAGLYLQRRLDMTTEPWGEVSDTRVPPGETAVLRFHRSIPQSARWIRLWITVEPDEFYSEFFKARLTETNDSATAAAYRKALQRTLASPYVLFDRAIPIAPADNEK